MSEASANSIKERLLHAIDVLCEDAARAELWACALSGFAQPVPEYEAYEKHRLKSPAIDPEEGLEQGHFQAPVSPPLGH